MGDDEMAIVPYGDGLFLVGNDIVCSYPLQGVTITLSQHQIIYHYEPYDILVKWDEQTEGVRTNPRWRRMIHI